MVKLAPAFIVLGALLQVARAEPQGQIRLYARLSGTIDGNAAPAMWKEITIAGVEENAQRACAAVLESEQRSTHLEEDRTLRMKVVEGCSSVPLPSARRGFLLRSRAELPELDVARMHLANTVYGEIVTLSAMDSYAHCVAARTELEARILAREAEVDTRAVEMLVEEHRIMEKRAEQECATLEAARRERPRADADRRSHAERIRALDRTCRSSRALARTLAESAEAPRTAPAPLRNGPRCIEE